MPAALTIFAGQYLVFIEAVVALGAVAFVLYHLSGLDVMRWFIAAVITGVTAEVFTQIGGTLYADPRPFAVGHFHPLIAHVADNGFPSDHALLAAFLVACVVLARLWLALPLVVVLGMLVDWARVGAGIHHPIDVIGSAAFVALGAGFAVALTPSVSEWISPHLPRALCRPEPISTWRQTSDSTP